MKSIVYKLILTFTLTFVHGAYAAAVNAQTAIKPNFVLTDLSGVKHTLANYQGKWLFINYWATWCPPCFEEVPDLINLHENRNKNDVVVIGIVFEYESLKEVTDYVDDMLITYPVALSDEAEMVGFDSVDVLPTTFIFNPAGELVRVKHGIVTPAMIEKLIGLDSPRN